VETKTQRKTSTKEKNINSREVVSPPVAPSPSWVTKRQVKYKVKLPGNDFTYHENMQ